MSRKPTLPQALRRFLRDEDGTQFVEFAILLPMLLLLFAVVVDGGRMIWSYQATGAGVRDAARYLARVVPSDICVTGGSVSGQASAVDVIVKQSTSGRTIFPNDVSIVSVTPSLSCVTGDYRVGTVGIATVTVQMEVAFPLQGIFGIFGIERPTLEAEISDQSRIFGT